MKTESKIRRKPDRIENVVGDSVALKLQSLRGKREIEDASPLISLDYRKEAASAPFQFDIANGKLHRTQCGSIPQESVSTLFGVWAPEEGDMELACDQCKPALPESNNGVAMGEGEEGKDFARDIIFGFLSIIDQFGSVLTERGREYRNSERGKETEKAFESLYGGLDKKQKEVFDVTVSALDTLIGVVRSFDKEVEVNNKGPNSEGKVSNRSSASKGKKGNGKMSKKRMQNT